MGCTYHNKIPGRNIYTAHTWAWDVEEKNNKCTHGLLIFVLEDMNTYPNGRARKFTYLYLYLGTQGQPFGYLYITYNIKE